MCDSLLISARVDLGQVLCSRNAERQDTNPALAVASCVQHADLQASESLGDSLIDGNLDDVRLVTRHSRERTKIAGTVEEVAVESARPETSRCADTKDSFEANLRRKVVAELSGEFDSILGPCCVPSWVEVCLTTGVSGEVAQTGHILVLCAEQEHIDRNLCLTALHGEALVEAVLCLKQRVLFRSAEQFLVLAHLKLAVTNVGQAGRKADDLASNMADKLVAGPESRSHG